MPVSITWSSTSGGAATTLIDHGSVANGAYSSPNQDVYLSHDGLNSITACAFYFQAKASGYTGAASGVLDFAEIKAYGDLSTVSGHGGVQLNMDPLNASVYNATTWDLSESVKSVGSPTYAFTMKTGTGDTSSTAVTLNALMSAGMTVEGEIPTGVEARFLARFQVPTDEDTAGIRQLEQVLLYTFTS